MIGNSFKVGERVQVSKRHWLRAGQFGTIIAHEPKRDYTWLVEFDVKETGRGFDDGGKLYMDELDLMALEKPKRRRAA